MMCVSQKPMMYKCAFEKCLHKSNFDHTCIKSNTPFKKINANGLL